MEEPIKNKKQFAYELIRKRILDGDYLPGFRLVIDRLSKDFGLSAIPVREALRSLEADGFVEFKQFSGAEVKFIGETEYIEKFSVLAILEGHATALSSLNFPSKEFKTLEAIDAKMEQAIEDFDFEYFAALNHQFHSVIYQYCGNSYLFNEIKIIWEKLGTITKTGLSFRLAPQRTRNSMEDHKIIIRLLKEKAPFAEIESFVREHKMNVVKVYQDRAKRAEEDISVHI